MTALEIANGMIDKLEKVNRRTSETLHKAEDKIKYFERQLADKDKTIKVLEERLRAGTDGILEMTNRQIELTITHLEMQIQKLLKEKADLEVELEAIKSEIGRKCETELLIGENRENVAPSRLYKPLGKSSSVPLGKSSSVPLEKSSSVPLWKPSRVPLRKSSSVLLQQNFSPTACPNRVKTLERIIEHKDKRIMHLTKEVKRHTDILGATKSQNEVLRKRLQQLCHGISELKCLLAFESENLSHGLNTAANEFRSFKMKIKETINNLNEVVQNIRSGNDNLRHGEDYYGYQADDKYVISCLQNRLKESVGKITDYENENKALKESLEKLRTRMMQPDNLKRSGEKLLQSFSESKQTSTTSDTRKLEEIIMQKEAELEAAGSYINTCQKYIEELENRPKMLHSVSSTDKKAADSAFEQEIKILQTKLDVFEKNIKTCEIVIEQLQDRNQFLGEENERLEYELHEFKSKAVSQEGQNSGASFPKFSENQTLKKFNQELQNKIKTFKENIKKLQEDVNAEKSKNVQAEALAQEKMLLQSKLDASDKQIHALETSLQILLERLKTAVDKKNRFETVLNEMAQKQHFAEAYENDVMALKRDLMLKEDEIRKLTEALHTLENNNLEMNHYIKSSLQKIDNLCKALLKNEETEDTECHKAIYKAALLHSAQALPRLDDNYNVENDDSDELSDQLQRYVTEVSHINELFTIKEQEREELLKEYLDLDDDTLLRLNSSRFYETNVQGQPANNNLQSSSDANPSKLPDLPESETVPKTASAENDNFETAANAFRAEKSV